ncbi:hypothetical protein D3C71_1107630 [compost metagenome]
MRDFSLRNEGLQRIGHVFDGYCRINAVLIQQVDAFGAQAFQAGLDRCADVCGLTVGAGTACTGHRVDVEAELGGDHHLVAHWRQRFAHQVFVGKGAGHSRLVSAAKQAHVRFRPKADIRPTYDRPSQSVVLLAVY